MPPRCVTEIRQPAIVMKPEREKSTVIGANEATTVPDPVPDAPFGNVIHGTDETAVHAHPAGAEISIDRVVALLTLMFSGVTA